MAHWAYGEATSLTALEDLTAGASVRGLTASGVATVESVQWIGQQALKVIFHDGGGRSAPADRRSTAPRRRKPAGY